MFLAKMNRLNQLLTHSAYDNKSVKEYYKNKKSIKCITIIKTIY